MGCGFFILCFIFIISLTPFVVDRYIIGMEKNIKITEFDAECDSCNSKFTYTESDEIELWEYDWEGREFLITFLECPICHNRTRI